MAYLCLAIFSSVAKISKTKISIFSNFHSCIRCECIPCNRSRKTLVSAWAADIINKDWTGPRKDDKLEWSVLEYNTMARPIISCASSYRSIAYLTGGRIYSPEIGGKNEVDYYLIENESPPPKSQLIGEYVFKKRRFRLYRTSLSFIRKEGKDGAVR